ncbi:MAG: ABC transporter permease [Defluviitaleaceae bacterium]|nr:ABC transporter permease [Defluviitaleaceae bacterium]
MCLTAKLALQQLSIARKRTMWMIIGIGLSVAMLTAVNGFASSAFAMFNARGRLDNVWERNGIVFIAAVLGSVIAVASIIVISNAFRVSAGERLRQFGLLKSVGATKKQIIATVMYEAVFLSIVGLPIGIIMGLFTQFIATTLANRALEPIAFLSRDYPLLLPLTVSGVALLLAAVGAFIVILISAWLPARKAASIPTVAAITQANELKLKKAGRFALARLLFGFEGRLAAGQLRRSRRSFRASVISITISIILLLATASLHVNLLRQIDMMYSNVDANIRMSLWAELIGFKITDWETMTGTYFRHDYDEYGNLPGICITSIQDMTVRLNAIPGTGARGYGHTNYTLHNPQDEHTALRLIVVEPELYATLCMMAGVPHGSNIIINAQRHEDIWGITRETHPLGHKVGTYLNIYRQDYRITDDGWWVYSEIENTRRTIYIHGQVTSVPDVMLYQAYFVPTVIVPDMNIGGYEIFILTQQDPSHIISNYLLDMRHEIQASTTIRPTEGMELEIEAITNLARVFVYGFVGMLTLIGITNVISSISTNTRLRAREFAILASVGMTRGGISKMLALESLLCSMRALMYGLPLGLLAAWGVYRGTQMDRVRFSFVLPWQAMLVSIVGLFILTFVTTMFSASRMRKGNIIEAIR